MKTILKHRRKRKGTSIWSPKRTCHRQADWWTPLISARRMKTILKHGRKRRRSREKSIWSPKRTCHRQPNWWTPLISARHMKTILKHGRKRRRSREKSIWSPKRTCHRQPNWWTPLISARRMKTILKHRRKRRCSETSICKFVQKCKTGEKSFLKSTSIVVWQWTAIFRYKSIPRPPKIAAPIFEYNQVNVTKNITCL